MFLIKARYCFVLQHFFNKIYHPINNQLINFCVNLTRQFQELSLRVSRVKQRTLMGNPSITNQTVGNKCDLCTVRNTSSCV